MNELYFIALIPPRPLKDEIHELKLEDDDTDQLDSLLEDFAQEFDPFEVRFNKFSTFPPRVVFIDVEKSSSLLEIQEKLEKLARSHSELFNYNYAERPYHPHVTLAFKDLTKSNFHKAWKEFQDRTFEGSFTANTLFLLKHNGKAWTRVQKYSLIK
jgi:2'-5' RNA ligase